MCDPCTPLSITATLTPAPCVVDQAAGTFIRLSSHWRIPSGLVSPRNEEKSCHGSGGPTGPLVNAMLAPALLPAAEDLANKIAAHLEKVHGIAEFGGAKKAA